MTDLPYRGRLVPVGARRVVVQFAFAATLVIVLQVVGLAQGVSRDITSGDFTKSRPTAATKTVGKAPDQKVSSAKQPTRKKSSGIRRYRRASHASPKTPRPLAGTVIEQLGITLWRLRPAR